MLELIGLGLVTFQFKDHEQICISQILSSSQDPMLAVQSKYLLSFIFYQTVPFSTVSVNDEHFLPIFIKVQLILFYNLSLNWSKSCILLYHCLFNMIE